jgi:hypothetical protein
MVAPKPLFDMTKAKPVAQAAPKFDMTKATPIQQTPPQTQQNDAQSAEPDEESWLSRGLNGVAQSLKANFVEPVKAISAPPQDHKEALAMLAGGVPGLEAYRASKAVVENTEQMIKSPSKNFHQAVSDFAKGVDDFGKRDYRNFASDMGSTAADTMALTTGNPVAPRLRELSEGARPHGDLATPVGRDLTDAATLYLGEKAPTATEYSPREVNYKGDIEGALRPANAAQGAINKSVSAAQRDVRFGDPAQAIIDENILTPSTIGRQQAAAQKIAELKPQLDAKLAAAPKIDIAQFGPTFNNFINKLADAALTPAEVNEALDEASIALDRLQKYADHNGTISAQDLNEAKQALGDRVGDWESRATAKTRPDVVRNLYHQLYGQLRDAVNDAAGTETLNKRLSNLIALKNSLAERALSVKRGSLGTGSMAQNGILQRAEAAAGHVAPAAIKTAQTGAAPLPTATKLAVAAGDQSQPQEDQQ